MALVNGGGARAMRQAWAYRSISRNVGQSTRSASGSSTALPSLCSKRLRSSISPRESRPASSNGTSADKSDGNISETTSRSSVDRSKGGEHSVVMLAGRCVTGSCCSASSVLNS